MNPIFVFFVSLGFLAFIALVIWAAVLITRNFPSGGHVPKFPPPPESVEPIEPTPQPLPEPSCLARGIARSIVEEPEKWEENILPATSSRYSNSAFLSVFHVGTGLSLEVGMSCKSLGENRRKWCRHVFFPANLPEQDQVLILETLKAHPIGQMKTALERQAKKAEEQKAREDYFNRLGCPESPGKEKSGNPA